jgi:hypothetical protein
MLRVELQYYAACTNETRRKKRPAGIPRRKKNTSPPGEKGQERKSINFISVLGARSSLCRYTFELST